jgi:hypothetical protein
VRARDPKNRIHRPKNPANLPQNQSGNARHAVRTPPAPQRHNPRCRHHPRRRRRPRLAKGEYDGISTLEDLTNFFTKLPNGARQLSIIKGAAHSVIVSRSYKSFQHVVQAFLTIPNQPAA